jgi:hypothetical protein
LYALDYPYIGSIWMPKEDHAAGLSVGALLYQYVIAVHQQRLHAGALDSHSDSSSKDPGYPFSESDSTNRRPR